MTTFDHTNIFDQSYVVQIWLDYQTNYLLLEILFLILSHNGSASGLSQVSIGPSTSMPEVPDPSGQQHNTVLIATVYRILWDEIEFCSKIWVTSTNTREDIQYYPAISKYMFPFLSLVTPSFSLSRAGSGIQRFAPIPGP